MGMFDYVDVHMGCPRCQKILEFQTKTAKDGKRSLRTLQPKDCIEMYAFCEACDLWVVIYEK